MRRTLHYSMGSSLSEIGAKHTDTKLCRFFIMYAKKYYNSYFSIYFISIHNNMIVDIKRSSLNTHLASYLVLWVGVGNLKRCHGICHRTHRLEDILKNQFSVATSLIFRVSASMKDFHLLHKRCLSAFSCA